MWNLGELQVFPVGSPPPRRARGDSIMWNLGELQVFPVGSPPPRRARGDSSVSMPSNSATEQGGR